jgi:hypothetical protein
LLWPKLAKNTTKGKNEHTSKTAGTTLKNPFLYLHASVEDEGIVVGGGRTLLQLASKVDDP